jgi:hypothetical protein
MPERWTRANHSFSLSGHRRLARRLRRRFHAVERSGGRAPRARGRRLSRSRAQSRSCRRCSTSRRRSSTRFASSRRESSSGARAEPRRTGTSERGARQACATASRRRRQRRKRRRCCPWPGPPSAPHGRSPPAAPRRRWQGSRNHSSPWPRSAADSRGVGGASGWLGRLPAQLDGDGPGRQVGAALAGEAPVPGGDPAAEEAGQSRFASSRSRRLRALARPERGGRLRRAEKVGAITFPALADPPGDNQLF